MSSEKFFRQAKFLLSAPDIRHLPKDEGIEIAFAGRSNAGKSSALNTLTQQRGLARISKTPGRTQLINVFKLDDTRRLIDLPGYGFAQVPLDAKEKWQAALSEYLQDRESLSGIVILMDIRHPLKDVDRQMIEWSVHNHLPILVLLTKADKYKRGAMKKAVLEVQRALKKLDDNIQVMAFSSLKNIGVEAVHQTLSQWYELEAPEAASDTDESKP